MRNALFASALGLVVATAALPALAGDVLAKGTFSGLSNHVTTGSVHVTATSVDLQDDFTFDGAPDPKVGFGNDGVYDHDTTLVLLKSNTGAQSFELPEGFDVSAYNEVYIWCEKFTVPLGVAKLQ